MKKFLILLAFIFGFSIGNLFAEEEKPQPLVDSNINDSQELLGMRKLDIRPGDVIPRQDNQYVLGNSSYRWANVASASATINSLSVSTITASSATITVITASSITLTNLGSVFGVRVGTFTSSGLTGDQHITGLGFKPRLVRFDLVEGDPTFFRYGLGAMDASGHQYAWGATSEDTNSGGRTVLNDAACIGVWNSAGGTIAVASFVSMDVDGFTINWAAASAHGIGFIAEQ